VAKSLERAQADYDLEMYSSYVYGKTDGKAEGMAEGAANEKAKMARIMLGKGLQPEFVAECTELPLESVKAMC